MKRLYVVIPCYNEAEVLPETAKRLKVKMQALIQGGAITPDSRVLFVDDGSKDGTWDLIQRFHGEDPLFGGLKLSHNQGHQNALLAGLLYAKDHCDAAISMDADLQDDIEAIDAFLQAYEKGADVVYGVRSKRETDTFFKRTTALGFYRVMGLLGVEMVPNHADYRLMSQRALEGLAQYREVNLFLRGVVPLIGYPSAQVYYERHERFAGQSKYPLKKMLAFAVDGITSFSIKPIRLITALGFLIFLVSLVVLLYTLCTKLFGYTVDGWATILGSIWMIGGIQLLCLGVIGEYIGKIYRETKARPRSVSYTHLGQIGSKVVCFSPKSARLFYYTLFF